MRPRISDWKWACISAVVLLGMALFVVFVVHPGGFEGQLVWYFSMLPGSVPAQLLSDPIYRLAPNAEPVISWLLIIGFNFAWYWGISYACIKVFRAGGWKLGSPEF
jgi:hypothetical protein